MPSSFRRRISRRRSVFSTDGPEQLETRRLLTADIGGSVFHDTDQDGQHDPNEVGITGAILTLTGTTEDGDSVSERYLTDAEGLFRFTDLAPGTYSVAQTQPAGITDGQDSTETDAAQVQNDQISNIVVGDDDSVDDLQFGEGIFDAEFISPLWLLASSGRGDVQRDLRADVEEEIGNPQIAELIRDGVTEVDEEIEFNEAPVVEPDSYTATAGETLTVPAVDGVLGNDSDPEDSSLTAVIANEPANGLVDLNSDGSFTYTPDDSFIGTDSFTYVANDGFRDSPEATVTIEVGNPNTFTVSASAAVRGDSVGTLTPLAGTTGDPVIYEIVDENVDSRLILNADDHIEGLNEAPVVLIEYLDFACAGCQTFHGTLESFRTQLTDVAVVHRYLPQLDGLNAQQAAVAAEAASRQDPAFFTIMMDQLFDAFNFPEWRSAEDPTSLLEQYAEGIAGLDIDQFRADVADPDTQARVDRDFDEARELGYSTTPTFLLNGEVLEFTEFDQGAELESILRDEVDAVAESQPFSVDLRSGEILVLAAGALEADSPVTINVRITTLEGTEIVPVQINVTS